MLASPQTQNLPLLLLANKQDLPGSLSPGDIRQSYETWYQAHRSTAAGDGGLEGRGGSLEVLGVSALEGCVLSLDRSPQPAAASCVRAVQH